MRKEKVMDMIVISWRVDTMEISAAQYWTRKVEMVRVIIVNKRSKKQKRQLYHKLQKSKTKNHIRHPPMKKYTEYKNLLPSWTLSSTTPQEKALILN